MENKKLAFGQILKELRAEKGLTQTEIAKEIGVSQGTIYFWENSINEPTASYLVRLSKFFKVSVDSLLGIDDERPLSEKEQILQFYQMMNQKQKAFALNIMRLILNEN